MCHRLATPTSFYLASPLICTGLRAVWGEPKIHHLSHNVKGSNSYLPNFKKNIWQFCLMKSLFQFCPMSSMRYRDMQHWPLLCCLKIGTLKRASWKQIHLAF
uniref:Uncharacterized protein n=1 Tax=Micrurus spixii TaxID=129469 RepID=A0A2D4N2H3_9SAUR